MTVFEKNNIIDNAFSKIEIVAAYVRVSTQEQKLHGLSLDAQKMKLEEYANKNNMKIVGWYIDEGVSGRKLIKNRPELQRMIQDAEQGKFNRIIFIKLDRFFRSVAEYHECMKRISPVLWSTTEEEYDLTTANGRMLVNMKLTIAEMEADQTGERIDIVNEYKVQTGQPLTGSMPFGFKIVQDSTTGRKKIVKDVETAHILEDTINFFFMHQSLRKSLLYLKTKHNITLPYNSLWRLFSNTLLYGEYRGNPSYNEAYITKEEFEKMQAILHRNVKVNTVNRDYIFSGLLKCPHCGTRLAGAIHVISKKSDPSVKYRYKKYRCCNYRSNNSCDFSKVVNETVLERLMLDNIERLMEEAKIRSSAVADTDTVNINKHSLDDIHAEIDRLNYSWQTGKIKTVDKYEKQYTELMKRLEEAEKVHSTVVVKDFSKVESILQEGWKTIYKNLDDEHKRAFWRSFIESIEINWTTSKKEINKVNFF